MKLAEAFVDHNLVNALIELRTRAEANPSDPEIQNITDRLSKQLGFKLRHLKDIDRTIEFLSNPDTF